MSEEDGGRKVVNFYRTKSKITNILIREICTVIEQGNYIKTACLASGISESSYRRYIRQATEDETANLNTVYTKFKEQVGIALAKGELKLIEEIREGGKGWQAKAWILERTRQEMFGQKQQTTHVVEMTKPQLPPPPKDHKEFLERRMERAKQNGQEIRDAVVVTG